MARIVKSLDYDAKIQNQDNFGALTLKPDIILKNQIIDTKYKRIKSIEDIKQSDKLQAFAYGINYGVKNVMLLYPKDEKDVIYDLVLGKDNNKVELKIRTIDLNYDKDSFNEYIYEIRNRIGEIV